MFDPDEIDKYQREKDKLVKPDWMPDWFTALELHMLVGMRLDELTKRVERLEMEAKLNVL